MNCGTNWIVPSADPCNSGTGGSGVQQVLAGTNVTITGTSQNPVVNSIPMNPSYNLINGWSGYGFSTTADSPKWSITNFLQIGKLYTLRFNIIIRAYYPSNSYATVTDGTNVLAATLTPTPATLFSLAPYNRVATATGWFIVGSNVITPLIYCEICNDVTFIADSVSMTGDFNVPTSSSAVKPFSLTGNVILITHN